MKSKINRQRGTAAGVALTAALALPFVIATPAQAAVFDCPSGQSCDWHGGNYDGPRWGTNGSVAVYSATNDNRTSSIANRSTRGARWFNGVNYSGPTTWFLSGGDVAQFGTGIYNDVMSSKSH